MHDDDFDRRGPRQQAELTAALDRAPVPGRRTLVDAGHGHSQEAPAVPGKRTLAQGLDAWTQGLAQGPDPVAETAFHVRKARELMAKLAAHPPPAQPRVLKADLSCHIEYATRAAVLAASRPNGREVAGTVFELIAEAQGQIDALSRADAPTTDPVAVAQRGIEGPGERLPFHEEIQHSFGAHDIADARAHVGGPAADASRALGAHAYTHGDDVAFVSAPSLRLAAHEAAHVVQQRAGVSLKAIDGGSGDSHEQHADAVADAVVRGESAEPLLDAMPRGAGGSASVQRKSSDESAPSSQSDGPATVKAPHAKWPVFSDNGLPYKIVSSRDPVQFWTISDWIRGGDGFKANGTHATSPACAAEILTALGWVPKERIEFAAKHVAFDISRRVAQSQVAASAFYYLGMPTSAPVVSRAGRDMVQVATRLDDPNVPAGTRIEADDAQRLQVIRALAEFTGLAPAPGALDNLRNDPRFHDAVIQSGVILWNIDKEAGNSIFGFDSTSDSAGPYTRWLAGKQEKKQEKANGPDTPKLKLHNYYGEPIPGQLVADRDLVEAGQPMWLEVEVRWPKNYPSAAEYAVVPMVTPGHQANVALLTCEWHIELVGGGAVANSAAQATATQSPAVNTAQSPAAANNSTSSAGPSGSAAGSAAPAGATAASAASGGATAHTNVAELHHAFSLPPGQAKGTFRVTVRASFDEYFEPAEFTKTVEVSSTAAAMKQLGSEAFADLGAHETARTPESFDASGSGDDNHGYRTTGELPASFKPSTLDGPDSLAAAREDERKRLEATRMYLQAHGARADVLAAVDRELGASRETEAALASDRNRGWQPFQIRGTYLSREDGVPSGPLTLYGSAHSDTDAGLKVHNVQQTPDRGVVVVQIRDLSRRFDNEDMTFTGRGETFDSALKAAFTDTAKAYPKGVMAIEAEAIDTRIDGSQATIGKGNGKTIGFEIGTDSRWKRVKAEVWSPVVNIATNLGAMALMAFVPGSAVVVAPLLVTYNSVPALDRLKTESDRGTLTLGTAATSVGEIALNLLPLVGRAKVFSKGWFVIEGANWGGQAVLMTASAIQTARALQSQDVAALAALYEELQRAEESGADPADLEEKRRKVMARANAVSDRIEDVLTTQIATNAMLAVAGSVMHNAGTEHQRGILIDAYRNARGGESVMSGDGVDNAARTDTDAPAAGGAGGSSNQSHQAGARADGSESGAGAKSGVDTSSQRNASSAERTPVESTTRSDPTQQPTAAENQLKGAITALKSRAPQLLADFPYLTELKPTAANIAGINRLVDVLEDVNLRPDLREEFLAELRQRIGSKEVAPERLHDEMYEIAHANPEKYLRQGARPSHDHIQSMGGLKRAVSIKAALASLTSDAWYARNAERAGVPVLRSEFQWQLHADKLVNALRSGLIGFDPTTDLNPGALVKGARQGSSGWYFASDDAGTAVESPATMQTQLAVGAEYKDGYIVLELPTEVAVRYGAAKPTALDLTLSPLGKLNKHPEPVGRTNPTQPGQKEIREVVLPPLPLSAMSKVTYVAGD